MLFSLLHLLQPVSHQVSANIRFKLEDRLTWVRFDGSGGGFPLFALIDERRRHVSWRSRLRRVCHARLWCLPTRLWRQKMNLINFRHEKEEGRTKQLLIYIIVFHMKTKFNEFCILDNAARTCPLWVWFKHVLNPGLLNFKIKVCKLGNAVN